MIENIQSRNKFRKTDAHYIKLFKCNLCMYIIIIVSSSVIYYKQI